MMFNRTKASLKNDIFALTIPQIVNASLLPRRYVTSILQTNGQDESKRRKTLKCQEADSSVVRE